MAILAGWITGEQVPQETIEQVLQVMSRALQRLGGTEARSVLPGAGILSFADSAYAMRQNDEPPLLDWIPERRTLVYRRPRSGLHPLYYIEDWPAPGNLLFASEIKALLAVGVPRQLHVGALAAWQRYGFLPAPWTFFKGISVVPAGAHLRWQHTKLVVSPASENALEAGEPGNIPDLTALSERLEEVCAGQLPTHGGVIGLTGMDSASLLALSYAHTQLEQSASTGSTNPDTRMTLASFDYRQRHTGEGWRALRDLASQWQHPLLEITGLDQAEFWSATIYGCEAPGLTTNLLAWHQLLHTSALEIGARVALTGLGGAPLLARTLTSQALSPTSELLAAYTEAIRATQGYDLAPFFTPELRQAIQGASPWEETLHARRLFRQAEKLDNLEQRLAYLDIHLRLPDHLVTPVYRLAQQERLALRSPYLHQHILPALASRRLAPQGRSIDRETPIQWLAQQQSLPDIQGSALPLHLPCASLWQISQSEFLQRLLSEEALRASGLFDVQAVQNLLSRPPARRNLTSGQHPLVAIVTLQLFCQIFDLRFS
ncbi:hypothetical protein KSD_39930 [Ktedonobacter sp. SOSP1-85]|uniref:asparagine synthase-related protein n=1 Tax=Ktedonobacter sp. SOSP1-85 TaxID=2778367 RepID=UPI001914F0D5|nr:asparagine synthase-related protein [Ktedonobacter sp. SOSP1-85]GHO76222.1 hypothetical protein KSD_39930 [Ktedonobacter sp. SOSP1-85]